MVGYTTNGFPDRDVGSKVRPLMPVMQLLSLSTPFFRYSVPGS